MDIYQEIKAERKRQIEAGYTRAHDDRTNSPLFWSAIINHYNEYKDQGSVYRRNLIKIGAVVVAAIESHDRA